MQKRTFKILSNANVADLTYRLELEALEPGYLLEGEFVDIALDGFFLRRPLSVCDAAPGRMTLIYKVVGAGTGYLSTLQEGAQLDILTGLGRGFDPEMCKAEALLAGGGLGAAPLYHLAKELKARGRKVHAVLGFNKAGEVVLEQEFRALCDSVQICTLDGSLGVKGFVTDAIAQSRPAFDCFYTCGPMVMMRAVCSALEGPGEASLEERMGCGFGICVGCTIKTKNGPRKVCKDGPVFKTDDIIW